MTQTITPDSWKVGQGDAPYVGIDDPARYHDGGVWVTGVESGTGVGYWNPTSDVGVVKQILTPISVSDPIANTTTSVSTNNTIARTQSIQYIRQSVVRCKLAGARPNVKINVFFDGQAINQYCEVVTSTAPVLGHVPTATTLTTDVNGKLEFYFFIPGGVFTTGAKEIVCTDAPDLASLGTSGSSLGSARATYTTQGTLEFWQRTTTISNETTVVAYQTDPLAQSFFTYGIKGGCFLTGIDIFFFSVDRNIPIRCELREMINGYPAPLDPRNGDRVVSIDPAYITTNSATNFAKGVESPTRFGFNPPVYLEEDKDYCFVLFTNSDNYSVFTSKMGGISLETGNQIIDQPYVGTMFKSDNNNTWTAEPLEDIKFNLYIAQFDTTTTATPLLVPTTPTMQLNGSQFYTTTGSGKVVFKTDAKHGLEVGDYLTLGADTSGTFNGLAGALFNTASNAIIEVIDPYTAAFVVAGTATSTGQILSSNYVTSLFIQSGGSGYTTTPTISISAPTSGTTATATATVSGGKIVSVTLSGGSGYTSAPTVTISGGSGSGAVIYASVDTRFTVMSNVDYSFVSPAIKWSNVGNTQLNATMKNMVGNYTGGSLTSYTFGTDVTIKPGENYYFNQNRRFANRANEGAHISSANSLEFTVNMSTTNPNISPVIDFRTPPTLLLGTYAVNNQHNTESMAAVISGSAVTGYTSLVGGSGYTIAPVVMIVPADNDFTGSGATATATISGGAVTALTISGGSGYTKVPTIIIATPNTAGVQASAAATISPINSELSGTAGTAWSRYLTKKINLSTISSDIRVISSIDSSPETNVDWYIRTSLSGNNLRHEDQPYVLLNCDVNRNQSGVRGQYFDYTFYSSGLSDFDTYNLKCVYSSTNPARTPYVKNYRAIVIV